MHINHIIAEIIEDEDITVSQLARKMNETENKIGNVVRGKGSLSMPDFMRVTHHLGLTLVDREGRAVFTEEDLEDNMTRLPKYDPS